MFLYFRRQVFIISRKTPLFAMSKKSCPLISISANRIHPLMIKQLFMSLKLYIDLLGNATLFLRHLKFIYSKETKRKHPRFHLHIDANASTTIYMLTSNLPSVVINTISCQQNIHYVIRQLVYMRSLWSSRLFAKKANWSLLDVCFVVTFAFPHQNEHRRNVSDSCAIHGG